MSKQLVPFKKAKLDQTTETIDGMVVYDVDAGSATLKHRYYVFDKADFDNFVKPDAETANIVVQVQKTGGCKEQMTNFDLPNPSGSMMATWTKVSIVKLQ